MRNQFSMLAMFAVPIRKKKSIKTGKNPMINENNQKTSVYVWCVHIIWFR